MTVVSAMGKEIKVFLSENRPLFSLGVGNPDLSLCFITYCCETTYNLRFLVETPVHG